MRLKQAVVLFGVYSCISQFALAADESSQIRHGAIPYKRDGIVVEAGATVTVQHADDARADDELLASFDIVSMMPTTHGHWLLYVEGNTSPDRNGIASLLPEANADAGSALDRDGHGRLQISALHYLHHFGENGHNALVVGLIDPSVPLDNSAVANDETQQFLATSLVNNPTIAFPDYVLGAVYFFKPEQSRVDFTFLLSSSHGLADNPDASYSQLLDVTASGKGVFAAGEVFWQTGQHSWRTGLWVQTAANEYVDESGRTGHNYGMYLSSDHGLADYRVNVRAGLANDKVATAAGFIGLALDRAFGDHHAGVGYTYTFVSDKAGPDTDDMRQFEIYYRYTMQENFTLTPSWQAIQNSDFDNSGTTVDSRVNVVSVRANYLF